MTRLIAFEIDCEDEACRACQCLARLKDMETSTWCDLFRTVLDNPDERSKYCLAAELALLKVIKGFQIQLAAQAAELRDYGKTVERLNGEIGRLKQLIEPTGMCPRCGDAIYGSFIAHDDTCKNSIYRKSL